MKYDDYIVDFLDGDLPQEHEETLFAAMNNDAALRAKMKLLIAVKSASKSHLDSVTIPETTTSGLFSKLGIDPESEKPDTIITQKSGSKRKLFWIPTILSVFLVGFISAFLIFGNKGDKIDVVLPSQSNSIILRKENSSGISNLSLPKSEISNKRNIPFVPGKSILLSKSVNLEKNMIANSNNETHRYNDLAVIDFSLPENAGMNAVFHSKQVEHVPFKSINFDLTNEIKENSWKPHIEICVGRGDYLFLKKDPAGNGTAFPISDGSFSALYYPNYNIGIGFELCDEFNAISYSSYEGNDGRFIEKSADIKGMSKSFVVQVESSNMGIAPFGRFSAGTLETGYILKIATGIKTGLLDDFSGVIAIQYSNYIQNVYSQNHYSQKLGLVYGLTYRF